MNIKVLLLVLCVFFSGCSENTSSTPSTPSTPSTSSVSTSLNSLEAAYDPFVGTREKNDVFVDKGGLNSEYSFYGVKLDRLQANFQENGMIESVEMDVVPGTSPESMRNALAKACRESSDSFERVPGKPRGSIRKFPKNSTELGVTYDLACIYEGDTGKMYISSSLKSRNP